MDKNLFKPFHEGQSMDCLCYICERRTSGTMNLTLQKDEKGRTLEFMGLFCSVCNTLVGLTTPKERKTHD